MPPKPHGAAIDGRKVGTWGQAGSFSFYPTKNLGAMGDAGAMWIKNTEQAQTARMISNHGQMIRHQHQIHGRNSRLDGLQAAILSVKLKYLKKWTQERITAARLYDNLLAHCPEVITPAIQQHAKHVYHLYTIKAPNRDKLKQHLAEKGISTAIYYPKALPFQPCYNQAFTHKDFPVAARLTNQVLSLPMYPGIAEEAINYVANSIKAFYTR